MLHIKKQTQLWLYQAMKARLHRTTKRLGLTSLIDVIFLLLLFFMLSSTFSKFAEVELFAAQPGMAGDTPNEIIFLRLNADKVTLNGSVIAFENLHSAVLEQHLAERSSLLMSVVGDTTSQKFVDIISILVGIEGLSLNIISSS